MRTWLRLCATASVIVGPIFGLIAVGFFVNTYRLISGASRPFGTVTGLTERHDENDTTIYAPTFSFRTPAGQAVTIDSNTGSNPPGVRVGQQVPILFNEQHPEDAKIATTTQLWLFPIVFGIIFLVFTPVGALLLRQPQIATAPIPFRTKH